MSDMSMRLVCSCGARFSFAGATYNGGEPSRYLKGEVEAWKKLHAKCTKKEQANDTARS